MSVVNPVTITAAARTVAAAWNIVTAGGGLNRQQREAIEAAKQAGYSTGARGYRDPQGRVVSQKEVLRAGRAAQIALPDAPPAARPSDPGYRPDITEKRVPPLKRPPPPPAPPRARVPKIPGRFGRIVEGIVTVGGGILGSEAIIRQIPPPAPKQPPPPPLATPPAAPPGASYPEIAGPRPPFTLPPAIAQPPPPIAQPLPQPVPAPQPPPPLDTERLGPIDVYTPYAAIPAAPAPAGGAAATPRTVLGLSPAQLAGLAIPTLLTLLASSSSRRRRDPLTPPGGLPGGGLLPLIPGGGLTPGLQPFPGGGGTWLTGGGGSTDQCSCPPKRKRAPPKRRTVCYSGTFIERASGLSKTRKRKIACR